MGPEAAVGIVFRDELAKAADPAAARAALPGRVPREVRQPVRRPPSLGYVDEVIRPRETRARLVPRAGGARQQARLESAQEARQHSAVKRRPPPPF